MCVCVREERERRSTATLQLHPLLLESLNTDDTGLSQSTLDGLHTILQTSATATLMSDHVPSLVPRLLALASRPDSMVSGWHVDNIVFE